MKKTIYLFWLFLIYSTSSTAQLVFEPPVIIDPPNPMVGDVIRVGLFTTFFPPCLILPWENEQGDTHVFEQNANHIDLTVVTLTQPLCNPIPVSPAPREYYELGVLEEGNYTIQTFWVDFVTPVPVPPNSNSFPYGNLISFSVTKPLVIDTFSSKGLFLLTILVLALTLFFLNKKGERYF